MSGILNANSNEGGESFYLKFSQEITFRQLYGFIKNRPELVYDKDIPQTTCMCKICENAVYMLLKLCQEMDTFYLPIPMI